MKFYQDSLFESENSDFSPLVKSPMNYIGGKFKLLPQILPLFPNNISTFLDLFSGGANVGINVNAKEVIFNDTNSRVNDFFRYLQAHSVEEIIKEIKCYVTKYTLSRHNEDGFYSLRSAYNLNPDPIAFYVLMAHSYNNQFRFNKSMNFNCPFGNRTFSIKMEENLIKFSTRLHEIDSCFTDYYFSDFSLAHLDNASFIYADPPYLITKAVYNNKWTEIQEKELYSYLDTANSQGIKFALSNVLQHKGTKNKLLNNWGGKYNIHHLNYSYKNSSYNTKRLSSEEVLITNY